VPNEIVIEAMIKGLWPGPTTQYFARKPPQTLEKLLQKMDEYIRADNDFRQRREEAYRFSEMTRGFGGRIHHRHVRSIHSTQNDDRGSQQQRPQYSSQASEEGLVISPGKFIAYSAVRTRAILSGCAMSPSRNRKR
jgi:hypothetical protein